MTEPQRLAAVQNQFASAVVSAAKEQGIALDSGGQEEVGSLVSTAAMRLGELDELTNDAAVADAETSLLRVVDEFGLPFRARVGAEESYELEAAVDAEAVRRAVAGLCPGLWPIC